MNDALLEIDERGERRNGDSCPVASSDSSNVNTDVTEKQKNDGINYDEGTTPNTINNNQHTDGVAADIIARELAGLSIQERNRVFEDINGMSEPDEETEAFLTAKLDDLDVELTLIHTKEAFQMAWQASPDYVNNPEFRLMFLRADHYNPKLAAKRFVEWFNLKLNLFGKDLLAKDITLKHLPPDALELVSSGNIQILPVKDSAGRTVLCALQFNTDMFSTHAPAQAFFYMHMVILRDEEVQRSGMICAHGVHNFAADLTPQQKENYLTCAMNTFVLPARFQGFHFFAERTPLLQRFANILSLSFSKDVRHRVRTTYGKLEHCMYSLMTYGIPVSVFPVSKDGTVTTVHHAKWLERQRVRELAPESPNDITHFLAQDATTEELIEDCPAAQRAPVATDFDILFGRGKPFQDHPGNVRLRELIEEWQERHESAPRKGKTAISEQIVYLIHESGGRFLKRSAESDNDWLEVDPTEAREKVAHGFRKKRETDIQKSNNAGTTGTKTRCHDAKRMKVKSTHGV